MPGLFDYGGDMTGTGGLLDPNMIRQMQMMQLAQAGASAGARLTAAGSGGLTPAQRAQLIAGAGEDTSKAFDPMQPYKMAIMGMQAQKLGQDIKRDQAWNSMWDPNAPTAPPSPTPTTSMGATPSPTMPGGTAPLTPSAGTTPAAPSAGTSPFSGILGKLSPEQRMTIAAMGPEAGSKALLELSMKMGSIQPVTDDKGNTIGQKDATTGKIDYFPEPILKRLPGYETNPAVQTFFDANNTEYKAQFDPQTQQWVRVGGTKADMTDPQKNALALGFKPGTKEYKDYLMNVTDRNRANGPFAGNSMDAQVSNNLLTIGPKIVNGTATPEEKLLYNLSYSTATQPRLVGDQINGWQTITPTLPSALPNPNAAGGPPLPVPGPVPAASAPAAPAAPAPSLPTPPAPATPSGPVADAPLAIPKPVVARVETGSGVSQTDRSSVNKAIAGAATLSNALTDYADAFDNAGPNERLKSVAGANTPLNTAYQNAALLAKGDELYQLGVLSGPDLQQIRKALADPSTLMGSVTGGKDMRNSVNQVQQILQDKVGAYQTALGMPVTNLQEFGQKLRTGSAPASSDFTIEQLQAEKARRAAKN